MTLGELARMEYELATSESTVEMMKTLAENADRLDDVMRRKITVMKRDYDHIRRVPVEEYVAYSELCSKSSSVWHDAKEKNDFALFSPYLRDVFASAKRMMKYMELKNRIL